MSAHPLLIVNPPLMVLLDHYLNPSLPVAALQYDRLLTGCQWNTKYVFFFFPRMSLNMQHLHHSFTHFGLSMRICLQAIQRGHKATYWVFPLLHIWAKQKEEKRTRKISCSIDIHSGEMWILSTHVRSPGSSSLTIKKKKKKKSTSTHTEWTMLSRLHCSDGSYPSTATADP